MDTRPSANYLENHIVRPEGYGTTIPKEAIELYEEGFREKVPRAIAKDPITELHYVLESTGQGPYVIWSEQLDQT